MVFRTTSVRASIWTALNKWADLRFLVEKALLEGVIDRVREEVLRQRYAQEKLQLDCTRGSDR